MTIQHFRVSAIDSENIAVMVSGCEHYTQSVQFTLSRHEVSRLLNSSYDFGNEEEYTIYTIPATGQHFAVMNNRNDEFYKRIEECLTYANDMALDKKNLNT